MSSRALKICSLSAKKIFLIHGMSSKDRRNSTRFNGSSKSQVLPPFRSKLSHQKLAEKPLIAQAPFAPFASTNFLFIKKMVLRVESLNPIFSIFEPFIMTTTLQKQRKYLIIPAHFFVQRNIRIQSFELCIGGRVIVRIR